MSSIVKAGLVLGAAVILLSLVYGFGGFYKQPAMSAVFPLIAIVIQIGVLVWGLRLTAREGRRYGRQIVAGLLISLIGGVLIIGGSLVFTTVLFPDSTQAAIDMQTDKLFESGMSDEDVDQTLEAMSPFFSPLAQALSGFFGTMITGLVVSLITAAFVRQKDVG